ncbi:MAG: TrkH family potassium uptake protein, partial [Candidatus Eisenbacteria bacterium]|nr:TrkH family potassium uptake protein [Candidatus Eisenbacteria bacterium]
MRERAYLRWRYAAILSATGVTMVLASLVVLSPLLLLIVRPGESGEAPAFIVPSLCLCVLGFLLWRGFRPVRLAN